MTKLIAPPPVIHSLPNGVRVVCDPMPGLESLALSVSIGAGARFEEAGTHGWAHLLEHMVFKGAGARSARDIVETIEGEGGSINAATGQDRTGFQVRCLKGGLDLGLSVLSDLIRRPTLNADDLEREKQVIGQEIAEAADTPDDRVFELAQARAFEGQALGRPILGEVETLAPATADTLGVFHRRLYAMDRIVVSAAGAVDPDALIRLTEQAFGDALAPDQPLAEPAAARFVGGQTSEARKLEQAHLVLLTPGVGRHDPDYFAFTLFTEILGGGMSSRLFQEVREARGLAYAIDAYHETHEDTGVLGVYAGTTADDAAPAARLAAEEIKALAADPSDAELKRAKAQTIAHIFMRRESPSARAEQNAHQLQSFDRLFTPAHLAAEIKSVTPADLRRIGERVIGAGKAASAVLGPKKAGSAGRAFAQALAAG